MISYLQGKPLISQDKMIVVTANGVGYGVFAGKKLLAQASHQEQIELFVHSHVREDRFELYGFTSQEQLKLFTMMTDVSGIGPKTALDIVERDPQQIITAIQKAQIDFFTPIPRIGKKTAQKIILELKSKLGSLKELDLTPKSQQEQDVIAALQQLGFERAAILRAIEQIEPDRFQELELEQAVKLVVKKLGR
jgi:Holliday junction DNA helicase RuvA